ncbi:MAG TPA: SurA N-terminal domain-containing protein [Candidatus Goldiibacteriota bacterium]|nr:SurA N-terminal domain-containing protein [Candidatus Goldiibacteriota bacterium]
MKKMFLSVAAVFMFLAAACVNKSEEVATVNGKKITAADIALEIENLPAEYRMFANSPEMKRRILDNLIVAELLLQAAEKEGLMKKPEIQQKIKETEIAIKAESEAKLEALKTQKQNAAKLAAREIVIKEFRENKVFDSSLVTDKEAMESYKSYAAMMKQRDPNAKVESYEKIKDDIKKSMAMQKNVENMRKAADIKINEAAFPVQPPMGFNPEQEAVKLQVQEEADKGIKTK